jgi:hypothetical protein
VREVTVGEESDAVAAVNADLASSAVDNVSVSFTYGTDEVSLRVTGELEPLIGLFVQDTIELAATAVMYVESE